MNFHLTKRKKLGEKKAKWFCLYCCLNGAAARLVQPDDVVIIMAYAQMTPEEARKFRPTVIFPKAGNKL